LYIHFCFLAASTDVERSFSQGRLNVSRLRHSLSDESTRSATVFGSWIANGSGIVPEEDLIKNLQQKSLRGGVKAGTGNQNDNSSSTDDDTEHVESDLDSL
jgi:hypothetical protein